MSFSDIYFQANEQLLMKNLIPLSEGIFIQLQKGYWESDSTISYGEWKEKIEKLGYEADKIYKNRDETSMRRFFYVEDYRISELHTLEPEFLASEFSLPMLKGNQSAKESFEKREYLTLFFPEWNIFAIDLFSRLYDKIPKEDLWEVFLLIYTYANYGFELFPDELLKEVFLYADKEDSVQRLQEAGKVDSDGFLTVYRGEGKRSTPIEKAYSWTLSKDIASKFAHHFGAGKVYQAKVPLSAIISYQTERDEEEVLLYYKDLSDLQQL